MATNFKREQEIKVSHSYQRFYFDRINEADLFAEQMIKATDDVGSDVVVEITITYSKEEVDDTELSAEETIDIQKVAVEKEEKDYGKFV